MKRLWAGISVCLWFIMVTGAFARLGENEVACAMRYNHGQDAEPNSSDRFSPLISGINTTNKTYHFQGWNIRIGFVNGIAHRIQYRHENGMQKISGEELRAILHANGGVSAWRPERSEDAATTNSNNRIFRPSSKGTWIREDGVKATLSGGVENNFILQLDSAVSVKWSEKKPPEKKPIPNF